MKPYVDFDIDEIRELEEDYVITMDYILETMPDINWDSRLEVYDYFIKEHNIHLDSLKISELKEVLETYSDNYSDNYIYSAYAKDIDEAKDVLESFITYLKIKYEVRNYTKCILRHQKEGRVFLRNIDGNIVMPNKQPLMYSQNIIDCITGTNVPELVRKSENTIERNK